MAADEKPNCYECRWRDEVPGSAHSRCTHPKATLNGTAASPLIELAVLLGGGIPPINTKALGVTGHPHGIRAGWFSWPLNYDPTWLLTCDGFEEKPRSAA